MKQKAGMTSGIKDAPTTVIEIGRLAGCSGATVSRAMNDSGSVSPKTREAIFKVLRQSQYAKLQSTGRRGRPAKRQKGVDSKLVELLYFRDTPIERLTLDDGWLDVERNDFWSSPDTLSAPRELSSSFYRRIIDSAAAELSRWGYKAVVQTSVNLASPESITEVNRPDRAGVLLMGEYAPALDSFIEQCLHPLVLADIIHDGPADTVSTDNHAGISGAFDHLYALGHRRIGFVGRHDATIGSAERFIAFKWKMAEAELAVAPQWVHEGPNRIDQTEEGVAAILSQPERPTAFICTNDVAAFGVLRAANRMKLRVPRDLSVVGFDDDEAASLVTPALTTVRVPVSAIGRQAIRQLMLQIHHPIGGIGARGVCVRLRPELVVRQSTANPPA